MSRNSVAGGVIDIELVEGVSGATPTRTIVGKTQGEISWDQNIDTAENRGHDSEVMDRAPVVGSPDITFEETITSSAGALETLGVRNDDNKVTGYAYVPNDAELQISAYQDRQARENEAYMKRLAVTEGYALIESGTVDPEEFATLEWAIHSLDWIKVYDEESE